MQKKSSNTRTLNEGWREEIYSTQAHLYHIKSVSESFIKKNTRIHLFDDLIDLITYLSLSLFLAIR